MKYILHRLLPAFALTFTTSLAAAEGPVNWAYWLTEIDPEVVHNSEYDFIVTDLTREGTQKFTPQQVNHMKTRPDGSRRRVISYFSIGEAEDYRFYWQPEWKTGNPEWLDSENPDWAGNFKVRYWQQGWKNILMGNKDAYLDQILTAGFDGIYLDIVDAFEYYETSRPSAERDMVDLVLSIAEYAKSVDPDFLVIIQNGERILANPGIIAAIDGVAKEDLYYGLEADHLAAPDHESEFSLEYLRLAKAAGKFVMLASYVPHAEGQQKVLREGRRNGFPVYFSDRELDRLYPNGGVGAVTTSELQSGNMLSQHHATLRAGQFEISGGLEHYDEQSVFREFDSNGVETFREDAAYRQSQLKFEFTYGITDHFELGIGLPLVKTELESEEFPGGFTFNDDDSGFGNLSVFINYSQYHGKSQSSESLLSFEVALPTDSQDDDFKSDGSIEGEYQYSHFWNRVGMEIAAGIRLIGEDDFNDTEQASFGRLGLTYSFSDRVPAYIQLIRDDDIDLVEIGFDFITSQRNTIEFYYATDLEDELDISSFGLKLVRLYR